MPGKRRFDKHLRRTVSQPQGKRTKAPLASIGRAKGMFKEGLAMRNKILIAAAAATALTACTTDAVTGERRIATETGVGAVVGALGGYLLGDLIGGRNDRTAKIVGAGI